MNDDEIRNAIDVSLRDQIFQRVKDLYHAQYTVFNDIRIVSITKDEVCLKMSLENKLNSLGFAHGGAVYTIADNAFAFAANMLPEVQMALSGNIVYHRPGAGKELVAVVTKVTETNSVSTYTAKVYCDEKHIATALFVGFKIKDNKITAKPGGGRGGV
ncbi:MAG: hotdog fold thioesterase [Methanomassiliicoccaceae archaeon]|jgi:acyl-CoA thioesterase|nr:hotdog fold thioesterase [Methanomassiliicoccaceae archaeon]